MLILVPGATGNIGREVVRSALERGHRVRALGRSPNKLDPDLKERLESFIESKGWDDILALDRGCGGVDAIICCYGPLPILALDGQLLLLHAAERAGVKRFHAASWNLDWSELPLWENESYNPYVCFAAQARLSSSIKPIYTYCGVLAMTLFGVPGAGALEGDSAVWVRLPDGERQVNIIGRGETKTPYATESDVANFTVAVTTSDDAEKGGNYQFCSDEFTMKELAQEYEKVRGKKAHLNFVMDYDTCVSLLKQQRADATAKGEEYSRWLQYIGLAYAETFETGTINPTNRDGPRFPDVKRTGIEQYIRENDYV